MKKYFLVDYENLNKKAFELIELEGVTNNDCICIFYSGNISDVALEEMKEIDKAKVCFIETKNGIRNALDMCLVLYVGMIIKENPSSNIIIVSDDNDYNAVVHFLEDKKINIKKISNSSSEENQKKNFKEKREKFLEERLEKTLIRKIIKHSKYPIKDTGTIREMIKKSLERCNTKEKFQLKLRQLSSGELAKKEEYRGKKKQRKRKAVNDTFVIAVWDKLFETKEE